MLQAVSVGVNVGFFASPVIFMLLYVWSREFPTSEVSLWSLPPLPPLTIVAYSSLTACALLIYLLNVKWNMMTRHAMPPVC